MLGLGCILLIVDVAIGIISIIFGICFMGVKSVTYTFMAIGIFTVCLGLSYMYLMQGCSKKVVEKRDFIRMISLPRDDVEIIKNEGKITEVKIDNDSYKNVVCECENPTSLTVNKIFVREKCLGITYESNDEFEVILA